MDRESRKIAISKSYNIQIVLQTYIINIKDKYALVVVWKLYDVLHLKTIRRPANEPMAASKTTR